MSNPPVQNHPDNQWPMTDDELIEKVQTDFTPAEFNRLIALARIGAAVQQKPTDAMIEAARMTLPGPVDICDADLEDIFLTMIETLPKVKP